MAINSVFTVINLYRSLMFSIIRYGCESWTLDAKHNRYGAGNSPRLGCIYQ